MTIVVYFMNFIFGLEFNCLKHDKITERTEVTIITYASSIEQFSKLMQVVNVALNDVETKEKFYHFFRKIIM